MYRLRTSVSQPPFLLHIERQTIFGQFSQDNAFDFNKRFTFLSSICRPCECAGATLVVVFRTIFGTYSFLLSYLLALYFINIRINSGDKTGSQLERKVWNITETIQRPYYTETTQRPYHRPTKTIPYRDSRKHEFQNNHDPSGDSSDCCEKLAVEQLSVHTI